MINRIRIQNTEDGFCFFIVMDSPYLLCLSNPGLEQCCSGQHSLVSSGLERFYIQSSIQPSRSIHFSLMYTPLGAPILKQLSQLSAPILFKQLR